MFNIIGKRYWFFLLSAIVIVPGVISLVLYGLNPSPDFVGGSEIEVQIAKTGQTAQLASLMANSTKTPALPAGMILSNGRGGTSLMISVPSATAQTKIETSVTKSTGQNPTGLPILTSKTTCTSNCLYSVNLTATYTMSSPQITKLLAALAKAYPAKGKIPAGTVVSTTNGSALRVQVPVSGAQSNLQTILTGFTVGTTPTSVTQDSSTSCRPHCRYTIILPAVLTSKQFSAFKTEFLKQYPKTAAQPGITPQSVNTVAFSACKAICYDIRSKFLTADQIAFFTSALKKAYPGPQTAVINANSVGGTVAAATKQNAIIAVAVAALFILCYITFAFRKMSHPVRYGAAAIIAMLHDVLVVVGIFSILGKVMNMEVDATFVTALLTIIGFSVHDTIVIFDRIRENVTRRTGEKFEAVVNHSVLQSFVRSINTSFTVVLTLGAIFLFTGEQIRTFVLAMLIGIISGTYSSIFNASPILVVWQTGEWKRLFGRQSNEDAAAAVGRRSGLSSATSGR